MSIFTSPMSEAGASSSATPATDWVFDPAHSVYYHAASQTFAIPNASGEWEYVPVADFRPGESSTAAGDKEDGEVDDDVGWGGLMEPTEVDRIQKGAYADPKLYAYRATTPPIATPKHILRLVVRDSPSLPVGGMVMIDAREGGVRIGRDRLEGQARLRIKEMEISKTHAVVYWGGSGDEEGWWIVDLGSTHGTVVTQESKKVRLSEAKTSSLPHRLHHLATITLGQTTLEAHIHSSWPCEACQLKGETEIKLDDGVVEVVAPVYGLVGREQREAKRKREMAMLKETLLDEKEPAEKREYQDRAAIRRRLQGGYRPPILEDSPPPEIVMPPTNSFAAGILASQGWKHGEGLGKTGSGRAEPITVEMRAQKMGIGAVGSKATEGDWRAQGKERRYNELRN